MFDQTWQKIWGFPVRVWNFLKIRTYRFFHPTDVAFLTVGHCIIPYFISNISKRTQLTIHTIWKARDIPKYRKVIFFNGLRPEILPIVESTPPEKRVFIEVGFFPQNKNIYFDHLGIHGYSSVRDEPLPQLTDQEKRELEEFKKDYATKNFIKVAYASVQTNHTTDRNQYPNDYLLVLLQLEADTAYQLNPFRNNQAMIEHIEKTFPNENIVFKIHPNDLESSYTLKNEKSQLLDYANKDLQYLLQNAKAVISANSTAMLEALLYHKRCGALGEGFSTNQNVTLECHQDPNRLGGLLDWEPDWEKVDRFLYFLLKKQIHVEFWKHEEEVKKLEYWLARYDIFKEPLKIKS